MQEITPIISENQKGDFGLHESNTTQENIEVRKLLSQHLQKDPCLDLAYQSLKNIPRDLFVFPNLQHLYLENNDISELPREFFHNLPHLLWLDLRHNQLKRLPSNIGDHRFLKQLLLEGNKITRLPIELGRVESLTALNLHENPLEFPPQEVVNGGVKAIKTYLFEECSKAYGEGCSDVVTTNTTSNNNHSSTNLPRKPTASNSSSSNYRVVVHSHETIFNDFNLSKPVPLYPVCSRHRMSSQVHLVELLRKKLHMGGRSQTAPNRHSHNKSTTSQKKITMTTTRQRPRVPQHHRHEDTTTTDEDDEDQINFADQGCNMENDLIDNSLHQLSENEKKNCEVGEMLKLERNDEELAQSTQRITKHDDIRKKMKIYSRKMKRKREENKESQKEEEQISAPTTALETQYRLRAFLGDDLLENI